MRRLVLSHNSLGDRGLLGLVAGCPKGQGLALTQLDLESCSFGCVCEATHGHVARLDIFAAAHTVVEQSGLAR